MTSPPDIDFSKVLELGDSVLASVEDGLLELANSYNLELELLVGKFAGTGRELKEAEREILATLIEQHAKVVSRMESARNKVGTQLREVQKKTQVIRSYFDQQAPRGGVSGTKKG